MQLVTFLSFQLRILQIHFFSLLTPSGLNEQLSETAFFSCLDGYPNSFRIADCKPITGLCANKIKAFSAFGERCRKKMTGAINLMAKYVFHHQVAQ
jgi:hypothetical protein